MAQPAAPTAFAKTIRLVDVGTEMDESFVPYALAVVTDRAIPDARDGLKPVQRRILWSMSESGLVPTRPHRKSATVVGLVMGKYHPHGDMAVYEAMVRLGQTFSLNAPLIDPHGNFGSLDDNAASSRYTEARLGAPGMLMLEGIAEGAVPFKPNYDGEETEPVVMPSQFPNLLVNGASGIAVGFATQIPTHNLAEVCAAARLFVDGRRTALPTVADIMSVMPGPDFPTGASIVDAGGICEAYETGRGSFALRAKAEIETAGGRSLIVVTELPFAVGPERVVEAVNRYLAQESSDLQGVTTVRNETDRKSGLRLVMEVRKGFDPQAVLAALYRLTPMQQNFSVNTVVLVDGKPQTLGVVDLLRIWVEHRLESTRRVATHRLGKARARLHIVQGRIIATDAIDKVVKTIRESADDDTAKAGLMAKPFGLSETQALDVLGLPLRSIAKLSKLKLAEEHAELTATIKELEAILADPNRQRAIIRGELDDISKHHSAPRRSPIVSSAVVEAEAALVSERSALIAEEASVPVPCRIVVTTDQRVLRLDPGPTNVAHSQAFDATSQTALRAVTASGAVLEAPAHHLAAGPKTKVTLNEMFGATKSDSVVAVLEPGEFYVAVTAQGVTKRVSLEELAAGAASRGGGRIVGIKEGDRVVAAFACPEDHDLLIVSSNAQCLRTPSAKVPTQGRAAGGVAGMALAPGATVIGAFCVGTSEEATLYLAAGTEVKPTAITEIPSKGRATGGVRMCQPKTPVTAAFCAPTAAPVKAVGGDVALTTTPRDRKTTPASAPVTAFATTKA